MEDTVSIFPKDFGVNILVVRVNTGLSGSTELMEDFQGGELTWC